MSETTKRERILTDRINRIRKLVPGKKRFSELYRIAYTIPDTEDMLMMGRVLNGLKEIADLVEDI
jgi:hypothetical protein